MVGSDWQGGRKDGRLYRDVRAEMQGAIREKYERLKGYLDERARRLWVGSEAITFGGGIRAVAEALKISPQVVIAGSRELKGESQGIVPPATPRRQRRPGGGRKAKAEQEPGLVRAIEEIVDPAIPEPTVQGVSTTGTAGHLRGCQEKGEGREFQKRGTGMAAAGQAGLGKLA